MKMNFFIVQEIYVTGFDYIFVKITNISDKMIETDQIHLPCEDIHSHSYFFYVCSNEQYSEEHFSTYKIQYSDLEIIWIMFYCTLLV